MKSLTFSCISAVLLPAPLLPKIWQTLSYKNNQFKSTGSSTICSHYCGFEGWRCGGGRKTDVSPWWRTTESEAHSCPPWLLQMWNIITVSDTEPGCDKRLASPGWNTHSVDPFIINARVLRSTLSQQGKPIENIFIWLQHCTTLWLFVTLLWCLSVLHISKWPQCYSMSLVALIFLVQGSESAWMLYS